MTQKELLDGLGGEEAKQQAMKRKEENEKRERRERKKETVETKEEGRAKSDDDGKEEERGEKGGDGCRRGCRRREIVFSHFRNVYRRDTRDEY